MADCDHRKTVITLDSGESICIICDDVDLETLDERARRQVEATRYD